MDILHKLISSQATSRYLFCASFHTSFNWLFFTKISVLQSLFKTLPYLLADFNSDVVCMISISPLIFYSFSFFQIFVDSSRSTNFKWYHCHIHIIELLKLSGKIQVSVQFFVFFYFHFGIHLRSSTFHRVN